MIGLQVDATDLLQALQAIANEIPITVGRSLDTLAEIGASNARSTTLYRNRTGNLRKETKFIRDGNLSRAVLANTGYAAYIENGNDPGGGRIYPRRAKALRFVIDGQVFFRRSVRSHKPLPFMTQARELMIRFIPSLFESNLATMIDSKSK